MKSLFFSLLLCSSFSFAETLDVKVKNFHFDYKNPIGQGYAESFSRNMLRANERVDVSVDRIDKDFRFSVSGAETHEFELKDAPSVMTEADTISVSSLNLDMTDQLIFDLDSGIFQSPDDSLSVDGIKIKCSRLKDYPELMDQFITGCIQRMSLTVNRLSSQSSKETLISALETAIGEATGNVSAKSLAVSVNGGKYQLSVDLKAQISGKIKSSGNISYENTNGRMTIKISEVKFGFFNITDKVFDELKKLKNEKLEVKKPYVYYLVK